MGERDEILGTMSSGLRKEDALQKSLTAGHWFLVDMVMQRVLVFGTFFITARLLTPEDYGFIALAAIYPALLDSLTAIAFDNALTQKKTGEEVPYLNVVWTFGVLRYTLLFGIVFFTAPLVAHFFHADNMTLLFRLGGLYLLFQGLTNIGQIYFFRELNFKKVFQRDVAIYGTTTVVTLLAAYFLHSYWAIFLGSVSGILAATIATYVLHPYRPRFDFAFTKLVPLLSYSQWVFGQGIIIRLTQTIESVLMGRFADPTSIGLYGKAKSLSQAPTSPLGNIIAKIGFSALVSVQDSKAYVSEGFHKSLELTATIAIAFLVAIFVGGQQLVLIILGPSWVGITPFLNMLTMVATLDALIITIAGTLMNALNQPRLLFRLNMLTFFCLAILLPTLIPKFGAFGAAMSLLAASVVTNSCALALIGRVVTPNWQRVGEMFAVIALALTIPFYIATALLRFEVANTPIGFLFLALLAGCLYLGMIIAAGVFFKKGPYNTLFIIVKSFHKKITAHKYIGVVS